MDHPDGTTTAQPAHRHHHHSSHSPSMNFYQHPSAPPPPPPSEHYRDSPQENHAAAAPLLPPIQHFDGQQMMHAQQQYAAPNMNAHIPPPPAHHQHYPPPYQPHQQQYANGLSAAPMPSSVGGNGQNGGLMRYPLPPQAGLQMGNNARKKDIKRRTKTGCLTCRKRRIKCDEAHPACRNCQKSKRECLGYDPIFKQQPGPTLIQPAPAANSRLKSESPSQSSPHAYRHPQPYPGAPASFVPTRDSPRGVDRRVEYVDPALGGDQSITTASNSFSTTLLPERKVRHIDMEELFCLNNVEPRFQHRDSPPTNSNILVQEVEEFYQYHFARGLDKLFETTWYFERGAAQLRQSSQLLDFTMQVMEQMQQRNDDLHSMQNVQSLEARLVWQFAILARHASPAQGANGAANDSLSVELQQRVDTLEHLLLGTYLPPQRVPQPPSSEHQQDHLKFHQQKFWHELGRFTSIPDDTADPNSTHMINDALLGMRGILGMLENRDVLYSLAIARYIGGRLVEFQHPRPVVPQTQDPNDDVKKLEVAQQFVSEEDRKGTTQVIQRICGMAMRGWMLQKQQ